MKDISAKHPAAPMAKEKKGKSTQKEKKNSATKRLKEKTKKVSKSISKAPKQGDKRISKKTKSVKNKKVGKKASKESEKKRALQKKQAKEEKRVAKKAVKQTADGQGSKKRKLCEKYKMCGPPSKMLKTSSNESPPTANRMVNGSAPSPTIVPQTTRSPWVLKLDISSPQLPSATNGDARPCNKSVFFIPKKNAMSSVIMKTNSTLVDVPQSKSYETINGERSSKRQPSPDKNGESTVAKEKKELCVVEQAKPHPQRMASLDAMAKMHVLCTTDRRTSTDPKNDGADYTVTEHGEVHLNDGDKTFMEHLYHKKMNFSKHKQKTWDFASADSLTRPVEHGEKARTLNSASSAEKLVKKRGRPRTKMESGEKAAKVMKGKGKPMSKEDGGKKGQKKEEKVKKAAKKETEKKSKKASKKDALVKIFKKSKEEAKKKRDDTKTQLKVKETIKMKKTCTYKSVTLNSQNGKCGSSPSQVGMTNYTKMRKAINKSTNQVTVMGAAEDCKDQKTAMGRSAVGSPQCCGNLPALPADKCTSPPPRQHIMEAQDCCGYMGHSPPLIPLAHAQSCPLGHGLHRMPLVGGTPQPGHYDSAFSVHRFGQQQPVLYQPGDYGCYCASPLMQTVHESCLLHKALTYPAHPHLRPSSPPYADGLCPSCHPLQAHSSCSPSGDGTLTGHVKHQFSFTSGCSHLRSWCNCYELESALPQHGCVCSSPKPPSSPPGYLSPEYQALVPCDQTPLDLSLTSSSVSPVGELNSPDHPQTPLCCGRGDLMLFPSAAARQANAFSRKAKTKGPKSCCGCGEGHREHSAGLQAGDPPCLAQRKVKGRGQPNAGEYGAATCTIVTDHTEDNEKHLVKLTNKAHKTVHIIRLRHHQMTETAAGEASPVPFSMSQVQNGTTVVSLAEGTTSRFVHHIRGTVDSAHHFAASLKNNGDAKCNVTAVEPFFSASTITKQEKIPRPRLLLAKKPTKRKFFHGWSWEGEPFEKLITLTNDAVPCFRKCYPSMRHTEDDIISERDCVLLKSGPKDTDLPFVAKVAAFWENPDDGEMMMSLLWYYRPEHTEQGRRPGQMEDEVFASKHRDVNSVACIEDKCYVLTFAEYCRYRANLRLTDEVATSHSSTVPDLNGGYPRQDRLPPGCVSPEMVFFCRSVYDFRQKRILKNPA